MPYDQTYDFDSFADAAADFDYHSSNASSGEQVVNEPTSNGNAPDWQWTDEASPSSGTGPPGGEGCVYPETSSPAAAGNECWCVLKAAEQIDAALYLLNVTASICTLGNTAGAIYLEAWDGGSWNALASWAGSATTTWQSVGPYDCSAYTNSDFRVRYRVVVGTGNTYQCDFAISQLRVYGSDRPAYALSGVTKDASGDALGSCQVFLFKDNGDDTCSFIAHQVSNSSTGAYSFTGIADGDPAYFVVAWKDDSPHVFDVSDHVLQPAV